MVFYSLLQGCKRSERIILSTRRNGRGIYITKGFLFFLLFIGLLWFLTAFRDKTIGNDTRTYLKLYNIINLRWGTDYYVFFEKGYQYFCYLIGRITNNNEQAFLIINATICYAAIFIYSIKKSNNLYLSACLIFLICFSNYTNTIRQGIAMSLGLLAYSMMSENKRLKAVLVIILASTIHTSAAALLILQLHGFFPKKTKYIFLISVILILISIYGGGTKLIIELSNRYEGYFSSSRRGNGWLSLTASVIFSLLTYWFVRYGNKENSDRMSLSLANFQMIIYMNCLGFNMSLISRAAGYFAIFTVVDLANAYEESTDKNKNYWILTIIGLQIMLFLVGKIVRPEGNHLFPYRFWST